MKFVSFAVSALASLVACSFSVAQAATPSPLELKVDGFTTVTLDKDTWLWVKSATSSETDFKDQKLALTKENTASAVSGRYSLVGWDNNNLLNDASKTLNVTNNSVTANGASFGWLYGVYARVEKGNIVTTNNSVTVQDSKWSGTAIYAARASGKTWSVEANSAQVNNNTLSISGLTDERTKAGSIIAGIASFTQKAELINNQATITDSDLKKYTYAYGAATNGMGRTSGSTPSATMNNNSLTIVNSSLTGGAKLAGAVDMDTQKDKAITATGNSVTLDNVKLVNGTFDILGVQIAKTQASTVTNSSVTLRNMNLPKDATINISGVNMSNTIQTSGNVLNLEQTTGFIDKVSNFDEIHVSYDFDKAQNTPAVRTLALATTGNTTAQTKDPLITIGTVANQSTSTGGGQTPATPKTDIVVQVKGSHIDPTVNLLSVTPDASGDQGSSNVGNVKVYANDFEVSQNKDGNYTFTEGNIKAQSQTATYAAPLAATAQLLNQGTDFMLAQPLTATGAFVVAGGGSDKFDVDHKSLKTEGASFMAGWASVMPHGASTFTVAPFAEYGMGSYDATVDSTASGDLVYGGFGALVKWTHTTGAFVDASLRFGWTSGELNTTINSGSQVNDTAYSRYAAAHLRVGYRVPVIQSIGVTPYARYNYAHLQADMANDGLHFEGYTSSVLAMGADVDGQLTDNLTWKVGAAWERELEGQAAAQRYGLDLASWDLGSDSGVVNLQMSYQPANLPNVQFDITGQGRMGDHQGVVGRVGARYQF